MLLLWVRRIVFVFLFVASTFYLFVVPILAASQPYEVGAFGVAFATLLFIQLWAVIGSYVLTTASEFYGFEKPRFLRGRFRLGPTSDALGGINFPGAKGWRVVLLMLLSYLFTIYAFGVAYIFISALDQAAFNTGQILSFVDGLYFSAVTAATIGYGDIVPKSAPAKIVVMLEAIISVLYVVFLFSVASSYVRELTERRNKHVN